MFSVFVAVLVASSLSPSAAKNSAAQHRLVVHETRAEVTRDLECAAEAIVAKRREAAKKEAESLCGKIETKLREIYDGGDFKLYFMAANLAVSGFVDEHFSDHWYVLIDHASPPVGADGKHLFYIRLRPKPESSTRRGRWLWIED